MLDIFIIFSFTGLYWTSIFSSHQLRYKKFISLPGTNTYLSQVMSDKVIPSTQPLTIVWINDNYKKYEHFIQSTVQKCSLNKSISSKFYCEKFIIPKNNTFQREYYLIKSKYYHYDKKWSSGYWREENATWKNATLLCGLVGGHLPWFESKDDLHELLSLFKLSNYIPTLEAIYIGLEFSEKVSKCCFLSWSCLVST